MRRVAQVVARAAVAAVVAVARIGAQESDASDHIPPPPPQHAMMPMSGQEMTDAMEMDDAAPIATLRFDRLEWTRGNDAGAAWKFGASFGGDFDKLLIRSEGERAQGEFERSDVEAMWSHAVDSYWDTEVGVRRDFGRGEDRTWAAFGVRGLAPYGLEVGATAYGGKAGRAAVRLDLDYDILLTQRLVLQPRIEMNMYRKTNVDQHGTRDSALGLRLRYEIDRNVAPFFGVERGNTFGAPTGHGTTRWETHWLVGLRFWY